ncbi:hypothetical protein HDU89_003360 [Geranomyces variabilis]|nr:hypothetical protein HDU89_003360 [Geranomyces variabilis]
MTASSSSSPAPSSSQKRPTKRPSDTDLRSEHKRPATPAALQPAEAERDHDNGEFDISSDMSLLVQLETSERIAREDFMDRVRRNPVSRVPHEVLELILAEITDQKTLHALSLVCRGFNRCTTPRLYLAPKFADTFAWAQFSIQIRPHVGSSAGLASFVQVVDLSCDKPLVASDERRQPNATILPADPNANAGANQQVAQTDFTSSSGPQSRVLPVFLSPTVVTLRRVPMEATQHTARKASASAATPLISFPQSLSGASGSSSAGNATGGVMPPATHTPSTPLLDSNAPAVNNQVNILGRLYSHTYNRHVWKSASHAIVEGAGSSSQAGNANAAGSTASSTPPQHAMPEEQWRVIRRECANAIAAWKRASLASENESPELQGQMSAEDLMSEPDMREFLSGKDATTRRERISAGKRPANGSSASWSNSGSESSAASGSAGTAASSEAAPGGDGPNLWFDTWALASLASPNSLDILEHFMTADRARRGLSNASSAADGESSPQGSSSNPPSAAASGNGNSSNRGSLFPWRTSGRIPSQQATTPPVAHEATIALSNAETGNDETPAVTYVLDRNARLPRLQLLTSALVTLSNCPNLFHISLANTTLVQDTLVEETGEYLSERAPRSPDTSKGPPSTTFLTLTPLTVSRAFEILLNACPKLISLDLSGCDWVTDELVAQLLMSAKRLRHLNLDRCAKASQQVAKLWFEEDQQVEEGAGGDGEGSIARKFFALLPALIGDA